MYEVDKQNRRGKLVAHAFIPLTELLQEDDEGKPVVLQPIIKEEKLEHGIPITQPLLIVPLLTSIPRQKISRLGN